MNLKKEYKKLEKSYSAKIKRLYRGLKSYLGAQIKTKGDWAFCSAMILVFLLTLGIITLFARETNRYNRYVAVASIHNVQSGGELGSDLLAISLGLKKAQAKNAQSVAPLIPTSRDLPILMYHRIDTELIANDTHSPSLTVSPAAFEEQLVYLKEQGYQTIGLDDLYRALYADKALPEKSVILTFDDGTIGNYAYAYPLLKKYNLKATFFVIPGYMDKGSGYVSRAQVKEMSDGGMAMEAHTVNHAKLNDLETDSLRQELTNSRRMVAQITKKDVFFIAYPFGAYNDSVITATKKAGYLMAVTVKQGQNQKSEAPFELRRYYVSPKYTVSNFSSLLH